MKVALLIVLSLSALAYAGPAFNKNNNQIGETDKFHQQQHHQQQQHLTELKQTQATETLKQWCFASQMSQPELTASFKKLVGIVKASPEDITTEAAVMSERICQSAGVQQKSGSPIEGQADTQAHELIKDVYMDALIACESRDCMQQLVKIVNSNQVDSIRASYYMTRIAVSDSKSIKDESEIKSLAESLISGPTEPASEAIERQKLFAVTATLGKALEDKCEQPQSELKQTAEQVVKTIVERYIKSVGEHEVQQYKMQPAGQQSSQVAKKIAKRHAALKALANIPSCVLSQINGVEEMLVKLAENKQELVTVRQSAIECLEQCESAQQQLKQITFDQEEPIEVRIAAYRALMTSVYAGKKADSSKQQMAAEIVSQVVKHCEDQRNQQQDDQFVLYAISHLDNCRTSQQPELQAIKECIAKNKQHYMQIQLLNKKFKQQLADVRKSSRNYKLEQEFNQIESGLIVEGDLIYESKHNANHYNQQQILPKLIRVNMSMPVMGETVNVVEITVRQNQMDEELLGALKLVQGAKFNSESVSKVVDSFKSSIESTRSGQNKQTTAEADLSIKVDGCTVVYLCVEDFKQSSEGQQRRNTRSVYSSSSIVDEIIEHLKRKPIAFNRGFNFNVNERLAKVLDVEANVIAGLRFSSKATGQSGKDFEIVAQVEPRFAFEAIVGPAKMSAKKLLQRASTKTALGFRLRFKSDQLVDVQLDLPMNTMELFTFETQMVEKSEKSGQHSYAYLPESIYGQEDIYSPEEEFAGRGKQLLDTEEEIYRSVGPMRKMKRSIFERASIVGGKKHMNYRGFARSIELPEEIARATGLRGKLRVVGSPKDTTFFVQAIAQKYEPRMEGYRMQIQKVERGNEQTQYALTLSTPGSRIERTMQVRVTKQTSSQRTLVKAEIQGPKMGAQGQVELVHDGRQWSMKTEMACRNQQWRHSFECGVQRGSQSASGRIATTYKPYLTLDSTLLRRPVQMQGVVSYQESPKSVISFELKSLNNPSEFLQGKLIVDERSPMNKRASVMRRSMQSPIELILTKDLTFTAEIVGQIQQQAVKVHNMLDWDSTKWSVSSELSASHKNLRKSTGPSEIVASLKVNEQQQMLSVARKCPQEERKEFRMTLASEFKTPTQHQLIAEYRFNGKRSTGLTSVVGLKHKVDYMQLSGNKLQLDFELELVNTERRFNEKLTGRTQVGFERRMKTLHCELSSKDGEKQAKVDVEFVSLGEHKIELLVKGREFQQRSSVRADQRQFVAQSRTEKRGEMLAKIVVELAKQTGDCQFVVEVPAKRSHFAADLKFGSGKLSSVAVQTPRFASKGEFAFETIAGGKRTNPLARLANLRLKSELRDKLSKEAYWMESAYNGLSGEKPSFVRFDSPLYRSDLELEPQSAKFGLFARSKRSISNNNQYFYSNQDSSLASPYEKLSLGSNKLWMLRSMFNSPSIKQAARRALFEYADQREAHKHSIDYSPLEERLNFAFERQPNLDFATTFGGRQSVQPMRFNADLYANQRPSKMSLASEFLDFDMEAKPFDGEESYAQLSALSRHRRSPFKKHESEIRYTKQQGYKAHMKHQDNKDRRHSWQMEADESPKKWAKMSYDSDKHGKGEWEHQWRKHTNTKRASTDNHQDEEIYSNRCAFKAESPNAGKDWSHRSEFQWEEPIKMVAGRVRRDTNLYAHQRYSPVEYLKHVNARFDSATSKGQQELYNVDFDYSPRSHARLNVQMPEEMLHSSSIEFEPTERTYKLASKLYNKRTNQPSYSFLAATKPIVGLASAEQEPQFFTYEHPMLQRQIPTNSVGARLFRQPLKLDYSDKYGRVARLDYDQLASPIGETRYAGLRQKRAAVYYKDDSNDFEHDSTYDFYPEQMIAGGYKQSAKRQPGDFTLKAQTKFGPVLVHADSSDQTLELKLVSPLLNAKLTGESSSFKRDAKLIKLTIDNKEQRVQLAKLVRKSHMLRQCEIIERIARKIDSTRFEHQSELLVSLVEDIFKFKSQTLVDGVHEMTVEGELNKQQKKTVIKIDGKRAHGQLIVDGATDSASLELEVDGKRTLQHQTRVTRLDAKFYQIESVTSYKQKPLFEMSGKISSMVFTEPEHLFRRHSSSRYSSAEHVSTFEATLYEPKPIQVSGKYDCINKEARIVIKNMQSKKVQTTTLKFDDQNEIIILDAQLSAPYGQVYNTQAKINLPGLVNSYKCRHSQTCQSELVYSEKSGLWSAKYVPGEFVSINTPHGKQTFNMVY